MLFRSGVYVLDVHATGLDLVLHQVPGDVFLRPRLDDVARLDELHGRQLLECITKIVAHRLLQHLVDQVLHGADHGDHLRRVRVGDVDLHLKVDPEYEALAGLSVDRAQRRIQVVSGRRLVGPVQREDRGRYDLSRVQPRVDRILARP